MASTSDSIVYDMSISSEKLAEQFTSKQWVYITDANNGSYNGQVNFETSQISNSGRWINYAEGIITVPIVIALKSSVDITAAPPGLFSLGWKAGWHHIIDSLEVQYGNVSVQQQTPYTNVLTSFKLLTSMSEDGLVKYGTLLNFFPDSYGSYSYSTGGAASAAGNGVLNNNLVTEVAVFKGAIPPALGNEGLLKRLYTYNNNFSAGADPAVANARWTNFQQIADTTRVARGVYTNDGVAAAGRVYYVKALASIRLADISDFCKKLPLSKGGFLKLTLNTNTARMSITAVKAGPTMAIAAGGITMQGRTNPIMITSSVADSPMGPAVAVGDQTFTVEVGIVKTSLGVSNDMQTSCRLYVPIYTMNAEYESQYLSQKPISEVVYQDVYQYTISGINGAANFNQLLTNGIVDAQYLVVCPFVSGDAYANTLQGGNSTGAFSPLLSPFSSEPGHPSPCAISQFQVQVSGRNLFQQDVSYDFQNFVGEMSKVNALNGGQVDELTSGLISYDMWQSIYRYYVCDLSRGTEGDRSVPKSILVSGINQSNRRVDYLCFVVFNRKLSFSTSTSEIVTL